MITRNEIFNSESTNRLADSPWQNAVFYDIETTGLGWRSSHIYLIGVLFFEKSGWILRQWFLDRPFAEKELLKDFSDFLQHLNDPFLVDYNGETFDLPYLRSKFEYYKLPLPGLFIPDTSKERSARGHVDLLRVIRPLKTKLPLASLRLQDVENMLCTERTDSASGKDLIDVYYRFLQTGESSLLDQLFLHNHDDVAGLPSVVSLLAFSDFWNGSFHIAEKEYFNDHICIIIENPAPFPASFSLKGTSFTDSNMEKEHTAGTACTLSFEKTKAVLNIPVIDGERKLFFKDFRNYYFLPGENQAIHKSVGVFTDPKYREQAKASTCYQRVTGRFIMIPKNIEIPGLHCFFREYREKTAWVRAEDLLACDPETLRACIQCILDGSF